MAKHERLTPAMVDALNAAQVLFNVNPAFTSPQARHMLRAQQRVAEEIATYSVAWFERRHEAMRTMIDTGRQILAEDHGDPSAAVRKIAAWQAGSIGRLTEDVKGGTEMLRGCASVLLSNEMEAIEETTETVKRATTTSKSEPV